MAQQHRRVRSSVSPQPDPLQHQRTTRITRSQSRGPDFAPARNAANTTRRGPRGASVESTGSIDTDTARVTRASRRPADRNLSIVEEDFVVQYPNLPNAEAEAEAVPGAREVMSPYSAGLNDYVIHQSPGAQSNVSGTTAISTAQTIHDPADLESDFIIEFLEDLYTDAGKILENVAPRTASDEYLDSVASETANPDSKVRRLLEKRAEHLNKTRENFGNDDFIKVEKVLASFTNGEALYGSDTFRQPDAVFYKANVATLASQIATLPDDRSTLFESLLSLDDTFPRDLVGSIHNDDGANIEPGGSLLVNETFRLALDIRTQFAISLLRKAQERENFDPDVSLQAVFFAASDDEDDRVVRRLRGWQILGLGLGDDGLPGHLGGAVLQRMKEIKQAFPQDQEALEWGHYVNEEKLESDFPWHDFVTRVLKWSSSRNAELEDQIDSLGGISAIQRSLKEYLETGAAQCPEKRTQMASQSQGESTSRTESQSQPIPKTEPGVLKALKRRLARFSVQGNDVAEDPREAGAPNGAISQDAEDDYQAPVVDEEDEDARTFVDPQPERTTGQKDLERLRQLEKQNKENMRRTATAEISTSLRKSFYDRQVGATRVPFDEPEASSANNSALFNKRQGKKRRVQTESDDEDEFEIYARSQKRQAPVQREAHYALPSTPAQGQASRPAARVTNAQLDEDDDDDDALPSPATQLKMVNRQARAIPNAASTRVARGRRPWQDGEVNAFIQYVAEFSQETQPWVRIKNADEAGDNLLAHRSNKDLKDKAVNIIYTHKMTGLAPPEGFEQFRLPAALQAKVDRRHGILAEDA